MLFFQKRIAEKLSNQYRNRNKPVKLHIACGNHYLEDWINIDISSSVRKELRMDVRKGIPFADDSIDFIFNEHFIEHLSYEDAFDFLKESYRALKYGGVIRTSFPDLDTLFDSYINDYWRQMEWVKLIKAHWYPSGCFMLNKCIRENGKHRYMYNIPEVVRRLIEAGFSQSNIYTCKVNQSSFLELTNIERRADSSVVEAVK